MNPTEQFPTFQNLYSKPCLLEVSIPVLDLTDVIPVRDPLEINMLMGKKGGKLAKKLAPLVFHNLLNSGVHLDDAARELLEKQEAKLRVASKAWSKAYQDAVNHGMRPFRWIFQLNKSEQIMMRAETKAWQNTHASIEKSLSAWMVSNVDWLRGVLVSQGGLDASVSLKKMAKMTPSIQ